MDQDVIRALKSQIPLTDRLQINLSQGKERIDTSHIYSVYYYYVG